MQNKYFLASIEGVNGIGKGAMKNRALHLLETASVWGKTRRNFKPFKTALVSEPPQIPLTYYSRYPEARKKGNLLTWRNMLKEGAANGLLHEASGQDSKNLAFADGFLASRAVLESYMREDFSWDYDSLLPSFVEMLPNIAKYGWGINDWDDQDFDHIVVKDRGTASTWVFQGEDPGVRELIYDIYHEGDLQMEDLTIILTPSDPATWAGFNNREQDLDVHDSKKLKQYERYGNLRSQAHGIFSKEFVYLQNDPTGKDFNLQPLCALIPILLLSAKRNGSLYWLDQGEGINSIKLDLHEVVSFMMSARKNVDEYWRNNLLPVNWFTDTVWGLSGRRFNYNGIPLSYVSGDMGLIQSTSWSKRDNIEFILIPDLYLKVQKIPERSIYAFNAHYSPQHI